MEKEIILLVVLGNIVWIVLAIMFFNCLYSIKGSMKKLTVILRRRELFGITEKWEGRKNAEPVLIFAYDTDTDKPLVWKKGKYTMADAIWMLANDDKEQLYCDPPEDNLLADLATSIKYNIETCLTKEEARSQEGEIPYWVFWGMHAHYRLVPLSKIALPEYARFRAVLEDANAQLANTEENARIANSIRG